MSSLNVMKLLASCKVLSDHSILLSAPCPCHNKISDERTLDLLIDAPEPVFRCHKCGTSYCAPAFMISQLGMTDQAVTEELCYAGYPQTEAKNRVFRAIKYLRFLSHFNQARPLYKEKQMADDRRVRSFGDWGVMSGADINAFFFHKSASRLNQNSQYHFLLLRDENGIPATGMIYTSNGSLIGEVKMPIPSGNISFVAERWTDFVPWNHKIIATPNPQLASSLAKSSVKPDGSFQTPVGVVFQSKGEARYYSRLKPTIIAVAGEYESIYSLTPLHSKLTPVAVYRMPGDVANNFGLTQTLDEELFRIQPRSITQDIVSMLKHSDNNSINFFCNVITLCSNSSDYFRNELVETFSLENSLEKSSVSEIVSSIGCSVGHFSISKKTFKIHQGQYCEWTDDLRLLPVSNFWISINYVAYRDEEDIEYNVTLYTGERSHTFFVDHKTFSSSNKLLKKLTAVAITNGMTYPVWTSQKYIFDVFPQIIKGLAAQNVRSVKKGTIGFRNGEFTTDKWVCDQSGLRVSSTELGELPFKIEHPNMEVPVLYQEAAIKDIRYLCQTMYGASLVVGALSILRQLKAGKGANLVAPKNIVKGLSEILGLPILESFCRTNMIQVTDKVISHQKLLSQEATISTMDPDTKYSSSFIRIYDNLEDHPLDLCTKLLPFLCKVVLTTKGHNIISDVELMIGIGSSISNFRRASALYMTRGKRLEDFAECLMENKAFRKFVIFDDSATYVPVSVFAAMKASGHDFKKSQMVQELRKLYPSTKYPIKMFRERQVCIALDNPNIFTQKEPKLQQWTTRKISLQ